MSRGTVSSKREPNAAGRLGNTLRRPWRARKSSDTYFARALYRTIRRALSLGPSWNFLGAESACVGARAAANPERSVRQGSADVTLLSLLGTPFLGALPGAFFLAGGGADVPKEPQ